MTAWDVEESEEKMFLSLMYIGCTFLLLLHPAFVLTLPYIPDLTSSETFLVAASTTFGSSASSSNSSLDAGNRAPVCDGNLLGFDMNRYSCLQAWNTIPTNHRQLTFGDRLNGRFDVQLPRRFSGREYLFIFCQ